MSTADAISPDSDRPWATPGAWPVAPGVWRIPLPLPNDGLRAVNVYALRTRDEDGEGLTLIDGGWAIEEASDLLDAALASLGAGAGDVRGFLVTHAHRDHYTQAVALRRRTGAPISLGRGEQASLDLIREGAPAGRMPTVRLLRASGSPELAELWLGAQEESFDRSLWEDPDSWIEGDSALRVGERTLDAVHTPGHTRGHFVFADRDAGLLLAGDHVLPTITPSIGFEAATVASPLADYLASLAKVRALPDLRLLPAHGPVAGSVHARVDELLAHHDERLLASRDAVEQAGSSARDVAAALPWTRRRRALDELGPFDQMLAVLETRAHLEVLAARGELTVERAADDDGPARYLPA